MDNQLSSGMTITYGFGFVCKCSSSGGFDKVGEWMLGTKLLQ